MGTKNIEDAYPLSPIQEGMIFYNLLDDSGVNVSQLVCRLDDLNVPAFAGAWEKVIERHSILRTAFVWKKLGRPVQVVGRRVALPLEEHDWRGLDESAEAARLEEFLREDRRRGFKPSKAPLMRLGLMRVADAAHYFLWSHHHLLLDGWSKHIIIKELLELYGALSRGEELSLAPARPYREYIAWLQEQDATAAEAFWRAALKGFTTPTPLPSDRPLGGAPSSAAPRYEETRLHLAPEVTEELQAFAREHQLTLNTVVQGAWTLMLSRYSGERDIVFGAVAAQRPPTLPGVESMVGLFINTLPVRARVSEEMTLGEWLRELQGQQAEVRQYEYSSLVDVQGWSEVQRGVPLFESMLAFENYPVDESLRTPGPTLKISDFTSVERSSYPLTLVAAPGLGLSLKIIYDCRYFDAPSVERILGHLERLLKGMVAGADRPLSALTLLSPDERRRLLSQYEETRADYPFDRTAHALFEEQVGRTPDSTAVVFGEIELTYAELNARANQLARHLRSLGAGPGAHVAICLDHSPEMVVAVLGVLKAGAAYVPLDSSHPQTRLAFMIEDASAAVLLTEQPLRAHMPETRAAVVCLDTDWPDIARHDASNPTPSASPDSLAYVIYTSGSTGEPKGVRIRHRALVNYVWWAAGVYLRGERLDFALYSSLSFDLTVTSLYTPLLTGNRVFVYRKEDRESPLYDVLKDNRVGVLKLTPSHLSLIKDDEQSADSRIRRLVVGGEALGTSLARKIHESFGGRVEIYNEYGPTEATVGCMIHLYDPAADVRDQVPIGRPAANTQIHVLDESFEPVAENVVGELFIAGDGLADGYLNREELTAERFVADPFAEGRKMYRSGDLARRLAGGLLEYVGRRDEQVKYHGYRVELNEIRSALNRVPLVRDSLVKIVKDQQGHDALVAYYVARQEVEAGQLRAALRESVIEETIPNIFVHLRKMPLTLNGKINHRALPTLEEARERVRREYVAARSATEDILAQIWGDVLGVKQVGVHDNFFELGGHSLLATQVVSRIREAFKVELSLRSLFESPTVSALAQTIEAAARAGEGDSLPPIVPVARDGQLPLSFAQHRLWFLNELTPDRALYNVSLGVRMRGELNVEALERALAEIVRRHEVLRTSFPSVDGQPVQSIAPSLDVQLPMTDLTDVAADAQDDEVRRFVNREARTPFDLARAPLLRAHLLRLGGEDFVLACTIHHIVSDGWTIGVMVRELGALYSAFSQGRPSPLPELEIQYADFAHWQRQWLGGGALEKQLSYWRAQLSGPSRPLELPTDRPRPESPQYKGASTSFVLTRELTEALRALSRREGVTLFMTMLAAFQTLLHRYSGSDEINVGSPVANRNRTETEGLIGCFINTLVLRTELSGNPTFREALRRVREVTLGAYAHQDLPFEVLVEALQPERKFNYTPFFQVWLVVNNASRQSLELPGLTLSQINRDVWNAQFDLTLSLSEYEDGTGGTLTYDTSLFDEETAVLMVGHFTALLEAVTADPEQPILDLPLARADAAPSPDATPITKPDMPEDRFEFSSL